jgi:4-amino-4-deoxy-L-arabinose transferase-like glycosyltransferase
MAGYFGVVIVLRALVSDSFNWDEGEQVLLAQNWQWGYGSQPPLFTWLLKLCFDLFGINVFAVVFLKYAIFFGIFVFTFLAARRIFSADRDAVLAATSLWLIPELAVVAHKERTHILLATMLAGAALFIVFKIAQQRSRRLYLLLGVVCGLGMLSKYSFVLFLAAFAAAALFDPQLRRALLDPRILLTVAAFLIVVSPHVWWFWTNPDLALAEAGKFQSQTHAHGWTLATSFKSVVELGSAVVALVGPMFVVYGVLSWLGRRNTLPGSDPGKSALTPHRDPLPSETRGPALVRFVFRAMAIGLLLCVAAAVAFQIRQVRGHWLLPLVFVLPVVLGAWVFPKLSARLSMALMLVALIVMAATPISLFAPPLLARWTGRPTRWNLPHAGWAAQIRESGFSRGLIIADNRITGGTLRQFFKDSVIVVPETDHVPLPAKLPRDAAILIVWEGKANPELVAFADKICDTDLSRATPQIATAPLRFLKKRQAKLNFLIVLPGAT